MRLAERLCVAPCPPLQVAAGGEVVAGGVDLVGVAADIVVQVEVWVARGDAEVLRVWSGLQVVEVVGVGKAVESVVEGVLLVVEDGFFERGEPLESGVDTEGVGAVGGDVRRICDFISIGFDAAMCYTLALAIADLETGSER
ncbi:hypothetical protein [Streptomyces sp. NPDC055642]